MVAVDEEDVKAVGPSEEEHRRDFSTHPQVPVHLQELYQRTCTTVTEPWQRSHVAQILTDFQDVFSQGEDDLGLTHQAQHEIPTLPGTCPIKLPPHRLGPEKEAEVERQVAGLLERGLIEPAGGAWSSPVVLVRKKDGKWRFCVDYRRLNAITQYDAYPLPRIDESLDALAGSRFFSTLDLVSGYWQVPLSQEAQEKSAFATRGGLWKWKVLPFGLTSAPATFQRLMERVLKGLHWKSLLLYLDDIIVIAPDFSTHVTRLKEVLERLRGAGLKLKPAKCELFCSSVKYLGHIVSAGGVATDPEKIQAVAQWTSPKDIKELQAFLGLVGYYRQFIPQFATIAKPLTCLTSKNSSWKWNEECQESFSSLKQKLVEAPILGYPDPQTQYILDTDASLVGVGAVLSQIQDGRERVIAYYSKTLSPAERNYCVTRRELLAVIKAVRFFRPYLYGRPFLLRTDHASLLWLCRRKEPSNQVARWLEILSEFKYQIQHRPGNKHGNADGLSRSCVDCRQCQLIEKRDGGPSHQEMVAVQKLEIAGLHPDLQQLQEAQARGDHPVALVYAAALGDNQLTPEQVAQGGYELKKLAQLLPLMRLGPQGVLEVELVINGRKQWCTICPQTWRTGVVQDTHALAHAGVQKTVQRIRLHWYWPGMTTDVRTHISCCEVCQRAKHGGLQATQGRRRMYAGRPWQCVAVDLVGPMPETARHNRWILVITDHFSRWQDALPLQDATAPSVASALEERIFCYFGLPEQLHSDQGAQFEGDLMAELCDLWGIQKTRTTAYHPQGNGVVERGNRALGDSLRALLLSRSQEDWDLLLPQIMRAFRATPHTTTGETANMMMMGREVRLPDQLYCSPSMAMEAPRHQYIQELKERLELVHTTLRDQQIATRDGDTEEPLLFTKGDWVWLENRRRKVGTNPKLQARFVGPYEVKQAFENHTYLIERQGQLSVQNERRLKRYHEAQTPAGRAPAEGEPRRRKNMKGAVNRRPGRHIPETVGGEGPPAETSAAEQPMIVPQTCADSQPEPDRQAQGGGESLPAEPTAADPLPDTVPDTSALSGRPRRSAGLPTRYRDFELFKLEEGKSQNLKIT
jgi:transposase InsO family protein